MSYIKKIQKALSAFSQISDYSIREVNEQSYEMFYDIHKLETIRTTSTLEALVTVYTVIVEGEEKFLGSASFTVLHSLSSKELNEKISNALFSAKFAKSEYYELPSGNRKSVKAKLIEGDQFANLESIAKVFFGASEKLVKFNSLELFLNVKTTHLVNSKGVDYKTSNEIIKVEAIPSYKDDLISTELYRMFRYDKLDLTKVREDALIAVSDVKDRASAIKLEEKKIVNVILREDDAAELFNELIDNFDYADVYDGSSLKQVGENYQTNPASPLTIKVGANSKHEFFDIDGVIVKDTCVLKNGVVNSNYGQNRFAYYVNATPSGIPSEIIVKPGKRSVVELKKEPYLEIIALSGIQIDIYSGYIGGEIRLAKYFDGKNEIALSGLSFSGDLNKAINEFKLSKEVVEKYGYKGPKYVLLKDMTVL